jgi:hypothetical protein
MYICMYIHIYMYIGVIDVSLGPGSCDNLAKSSARWFGETKFVDGNFPDIPAGVLSKEGGTGTVKYVHQDRYV